MTRDDLPNVVAQSLLRLGGKAPLVEVAKDIWAHHEKKLSQSGDLFYTWQYDMRWAAQKLRDANKLSYVREGGRSLWWLI